MTYRDDYPSEPIGGDNPYYRCSVCGRSAPDINGRIEGHNSWCSWRQEQERKASTPLQHPSTRPSRVEGGFWCDKVPYGEQRCHKQCALCAEADEATGETK